MGTKTKKLHINQTVASNIRAVIPQRFRRRALSEKQNSKCSQNTLANTSGPVLGLHRPHKLQEIPEVSASSRTTLSRKYSTHHVRALDGSIEVPSSIVDPTHQAVKNVVTSSGSYHAVSRHNVPTTSHPNEFESLTPSTLSLPLHDIPRRKSSVTAFGQNRLESHHGSLQDLRSQDVNNTRYVSSRGRANSPVRHVLAKGSQSSDALRASPSRTFIRTTTPYYLLDNDNTRNPRVEMSVRLPSPLFVGGGTVEGQVELRIDASSSKKMTSEPLFISRLSVDIVGVEEVEDGRRWIFLTLATEMFDSRHPPPSTLVHSQTPEKGSELYWQTRPATVTVPFCINLPLKLGPPPYSSRQASIRYFLCPSAVIKSGEKRSAIRQKWSIQMLTVHDPEKALASLPSPLLATDILMLSHTPVINSVKLTAGLHRQTWVSGSVIFVDIHVVNGTEKPLKRIELQLEKSVLWFSHPAAGTVEKRSNNLRLPAKIDTEAVSKHIIKRGKDWSGVTSQAAEVRTCKLEIPKAHITVGNCRFFEVRYFVKVSVSVGRKSVAVQLPVSLIHINSLDILPNSVEQVAVAIEAKRSMNKAGPLGEALCQQHTQGQAFTAACRRTIKTSIAAPEDTIGETVGSLSNDVSGTPQPQLKQYTHEPNCNTNTDLANDKENVKQRSPSCYRHLASHPSCYHCHLLYAEYATKQSPRTGPKLPRLQVSTSGLGFSESEFELPPDSPRKVMLSEKEREMINHERELKLQRQLSQHKARRDAVGRGNSKAVPGFMTWRNVALPSVREREKPDQHPDERHLPARRSTQHHSRASVHRKSLPPMSTTSRSKTRTNGFRASFGNDGSARRTTSQMRGMRSLDQGYKHSWFSLGEDNVFAPRKPSDEHSGRVGERKPDPKQHNKQLV